MHFFWLWGLRTNWVTARSAVSNSQEQRCKEEEFACEQAEFATRIFLSLWSLHVFIVNLAFVWGILCWYSPAFLPSSRKASKQNTSFTELLLPVSSAEAEPLCLILKMPSKIQGKLLSSLCILAGHLQACSLPGTSAQGEMEMLTWQIPASAQEKLDTKAWVLLVSKQKRRLLANHPLGQLFQKKISRENPVWLLLEFFGLAPMAAPKLGTVENWPLGYAGPCPRASHSSGSISKSSRKTMGGTRGGSWSYRLL